MDSKKIIRWAVIAPGGIAGKFVRDLRLVKNAELWAVSSRDPVRAEKYAKEYGAVKAYSSDEAIGADPEIDVVYIASPHQAHFSTALALLRAGKAVLCEKPLTVNAAQARELIDTARASRVFLMEAVWTRFLPIYGRVREWLDAEKIGPIRLVNSTFCFKAEPEFERRWYNPELAGGALLDLGIYNLTMTQWILKSEPESVLAQTHFAKTGADELTSALLKYSGGRTAQFTCGLSTGSDNALVISGEKGHIRLAGGFHCANEATLTTAEGSETIRLPFRGEGFEYEIEEVMRCLENGEIESPKISHADSLATMTLMDAIRAQIGLVYPFEK